MSESNLGASAPALFPVPFRGTTLYLTERNGQPFAPMKPIVEGMGLDWRSQHAKVSADPSRWGVVEITTPSDGGPQKTLCLPLRKLPGWLMTIHANKVRADLRERIRAYQAECDDALWAYWSRQAPASTETLPMTQDAPRLPSRLLMRLNRDGTHSVTPVSDDAMVITPEELPAWIADPMGSPIPSALLVSIIEAAAGRLRRKEGRA